MNPKSRRRGLTRSIWIGVCRRLVLSPLPRRFETWQCRLFFRIGFPQRLPVEAPNMDVNGSLSATPAFKDQKFMKGRRSARPFAVWTRTRKRSISAVTLPIKLLHFIISAIIAFGRARFDS